MRFLLALFTVLSINMFALPAVQAEKQVILVLDASGSMWGQIDGRPKIAIAREVVDSMLKDWDSKNQIGLVTYGHRTKGDCKDIETLIPVGKLDIRAFNKAVAGLNPRGKTPLTDAVRIAAQKLKYTENEATVILISDGKETCNADPCAVAAELNKAGVDFTTHVIGFDVTEKEGLAQLQCMAKNTGGEFLTAKDASGLKAALKTAIKKVEAKPTPKVDPKAPVNVHLYSVLKAGGEKVSGSWFKVVSEEKDNAGQIKRKEVATNGYYAEVKFKIAPGSYIASAKNGYATVEVPVEIKAGEGITADIIYNAGRVKLISYMKAGDKPVGSSWFKVFKEGKDDFGKPLRKQVASNGYYAETVFIIPAGSYVATASKGKAYAEKPIMVEAGKGMTVGLDYKAGFLKTISVARAGGKPVGGSWFKIFREGKDDFGKPTEIEVTGNGYYAETTFTLPEGEYIARASNGKKKGSTRIKVVAGKGVEVEIVLEESK